MTETEKLEAQGVVAWLYDGPESEHYICEHRDVSYNWLVRNGWTETPLVALRSASTPEAPSGGQVVGKVNPWRDDLSGASLGFDDGIFNINRNGSGSICFREEVLKWEDNEGTDYRFANIAASEVEAIRDFLNKWIPPALRQAPAEARRESELREAAQAALDFLKSAPLESGYCCCGSPVEGHSMGDGHSPVDELAYYASSVEERLRAALQPSGETERG